MTLTRQAKYKRRMWLANRCATCGQPRNLYARLCDACRAKQRAYQRRRKGSVPWTPGLGVGQMPYDWPGAAEENA